MQEALNLHDARDRAETGRALLEGPHLLEEAVASGVRVERVFALGEDDASSEAARRCGAELVLVDERGLRRLATTEHPQSPVAVMVIPPGAVPSAGHLLVAWGVGDPGNVGTLIRCAAAFGLGFAAGPGTADPWGPKVLRAGAGGHFRAGVARVEAVEALRTGGRRLVATVARWREAALGPAPDPARHPGGRRGPGAAGRRGGGVRFVGHHPHARGRREPQRRRRRGDRGL